MRQLWLSLASDVDVAVSYDDAIAWGKQEFVNLYLESVYGSKRLAAEEWAKRQMSERDTHLRDIAPEIKR